LAVDDMTVQHNVAVSHLQIHSGALPGEVAAVLGLGGLGCHVVVREFLSPRAREEQTLPDGEFRGQRAETSWWRCCAAIGNDDLRVKEAAMQADELTAEFGIVGVLDFVETEHALVKAAVSLDGVAGELYLQGAHLTAWQPSGERPVLFTSPNSAFAPGRAIRGGIPIIFPWFGANRDAPAAPQHGFARTTTWHLDGVETAGRESLTLTM
jgi:hypothetical protein